MRLKRFYTSREVAGLTGLSARQLQWWDAHRLFASAIPSHRTEAGGFTERRYTPMDVLELQVLADLRRDHRHWAAGSLHALADRRAVEQRDGTGSLHEQPLRSSR